MRMLWKVLLACLVSLPVGVYVASTLLSSNAEPPDHRAPIVVEQPATPSGSAGDQPPRARPSATDDDSGRRDDDSDGRSDKDSDDRSDDDSDDGDRDDRVDTVNPSPDDIEDPEDRDDDDRDRGGDDD